MTIEPLRPFLSNSDGVSFTLSVSDEMAEGATGNMTARLNLRIRPFSRVLESALVNPPELGGESFEKSKSRVTGQRCSRRRASYDLGTRRGSPPSKNECRPGPVEGEKIRGAEG